MSPIERITVQPVRGKKDLLRFIKFPWKVYDGNGYWVPPLISDRKKLLDRKRHPFYQHAELALFLAQESGQVVGRIAAIRNRLHNSFHNENIGFFGFFESINDQEVASCLFDAAKGWLQSKGLTAMRGPTSPSMNDECGLLIEGFNKSPAVMTPYNPPYYATLFENYGLTKVMDLNGYSLHKDRVDIERISRLAERARQRHRVRIRPVRMNRFHEDVNLVKELYNRAWSANWGFVPLTDGEIDQLARDLKPIIDPELALFAEVNGQAVGFALALPDFNLVLKKIPSGRLFPFGLFKILLHRSKIDSLRMLIAGVVREYQRRAIDALIYTELLQRATSKGIDHGEATWVLETNEMMKRGLKAMNAFHTKTYRMYQMSIE